MKLTIEFDVDDSLSVEVARINDAIAAEMLCDRIGTPESHKISAKVAKTEVPDPYPEYADHTGDSRYCRPRDSDW